MTIIGKNSLTGSGANISTSTVPKLFSGAVEAVLPADQEIIGAHIGWGDITSSGAGTIEIGLYDITSGINSAPLIAASTQTIAYDNDVLTGDQWLSATGLSVDLSAYSGQTLVAAVATPATSQFPVMLENSGGTRNDHSTAVTALPTTYVDSSTSSQSFSLYFETGTIVTGPTITNIDTDNDVYPGQSAVITGTGFEASQGSGTVVLGGETQTVTAWADTSITITVVQGGMDYNNNHDLVVTNDSAEASPGLTATLSADSDHNEIDVLNPVSDNTSLFYLASPAVATGDQLETPKLTDQGKTLTAAADGTFVITAASGLQTFSIRVWDATDETWSASTVATINGVVVSGGMSEAMVSDMTTAMVN